MMNSDSKYWENRVADISNDGAGYAKMIELIRLHNSIPNSIPNVCRRIVRNGVINKAPQFDLVLGLHFDGYQYYIAPKPIKSDTNFDEYGIPANLDKSFMYASSIAEAKELGQKNSHLYISLASPLANAKKMGFLVAYEKQLEKGNIEYILFHPSYNATMHFELTSDGNLDSYYGDPSRPYVKMPRKVDQLDCVTNYSMDDNLIGKLAQGIPAAWPTITSKRDLFFVSTEDRELISHLSDSVDEDYWAKREFFSIRSLQKIALSSELMDLMGLDNCYSVKGVTTNIGLSPQEALNSIKGKGK